MIYLLGIAGLLIGIVIGALASSRKSKVALAVAEQRLTDVTRQLDAEKFQIQSSRDSLAESDRNLAVARTQIIAAEKNLLDQRNLLDGAQHQLRLAFASASAEALSRNNEAFLQLAKERFATISAEAVGSLDQRKEQIDALAQADARTHGPIPNPRRRNRKIAGRILQHASANSSAPWPKASERSTRKPRNW